MQTEHSPTAHQKAVGHRFNEKNTPTEKRIQAAAVRDLCGGVSDMWLWRRLDSDPTFPRPVYISKRRFWKESEIIAWLESQEMQGAA